MVEIKHEFQDEVPAELRKLERLRPIQKFDALRSEDKEEVRQLLKKEQHGLCVYCERKLVSGGGRIDHIQSQDKHPELTFTFSNLCLSCFGYYPDDGKTKQHSCDQAKGNHDLGDLCPREGVNRLLAFNPATGTIGSTLASSDPKLTEIEKTLHLLGLQNIYLCNHRKQIHESLTALLAELGDDKDLLSYMSKEDEFYWTMANYFSRANS
jgi:uncharacterized protein (TIGR02646 family)